MLDQYFTGQFGRMGEMEIFLYIRFQEETVGDSVIRQKAMSCAGETLGLQFMDQGGKETKQFWAWFQQWYGWYDNLSVYDQLSIEIAIDQGKDLTKWKPSGEKM